MTYNVFISTIFFGFPTSSVLLIFCHEICPLLENQNTAVRVLLKFPWSNTLDFARISLSN